MRCRTDARRRRVVHRFSDRWWRHCHNKWHVLLRPWIPGANSLRRQSIRCAVCVDECNDNRSVYFQRYVKWVSERKLPDQSGHFHCRFGRQWNCDSTSHFNGLDSMGRPIFFFSTATFQFEEVPEPASILLFGSGVAFVTAKLRRRFSSQR